MSTIINTLLTRRSVLAKEMCEPGPSSEQIETILAAGHRVPDHGKIGPWRFIVFIGDARQKFSTELANIFKSENSDANEALMTFESSRFMRAPLVIGVVASPDTEHKVPVWEQHLSTGAACQNILLAANGLGFSAQWLTEWYSYNNKVNELLQLNEQEQMAGFIYIGSASTPPKERNRPSLEERTAYWK